MYCRLKDLLRSDGSAVNDKKEQLNVYKQHSVNVSPNKGLPADHTHWESDDDTDSDGASTPLKCHDNRIILWNKKFYHLRMHLFLYLAILSMDL